MSFTTPALQRRAASAGARKQRGKKVIWGQAKSLRVPPVLLLRPSNVSDSFPFVVEGSSNFSVFKAGRLRLTSNM